MAGLEPQHAAAYAGRRRQAYEQALAASDAHTRAVLEAAEANRERLG